MAAAGLRQHLRRAALAVSEVRGYLPNGYATLTDARQGLTRYFAFYNEERPHQALKYRTPAEVHADVYP